MKNEIVGWIFIAVLALAMYLMIQNANRIEEKKEQQEKLFQEAQERGNQERTEDVRSNIQELSRQLSSNLCKVEYSNWSLCLPTGQQTRIVTNLPNGCSIGETARTCNYTGSSVFELNMDQINEMVVSDLIGRGGSFRYTTYDQETNGKYVNNINLAVEPTTQNLAITRQTIISESGQLFSDTTLYDAFGDSRPDVFSTLGQPALALDEISPEISAQYFVMWDQIISQYMLFYAD